MRENWRLFTVFLALWSLVYIPAASTSCVPPVNVNSITIEQIVCVWHHQIFVTNISMTFNFACDIMEFMLTGNGSGLAASSFFQRPNADSPWTFFQLTQLAPGVILSEGINTPATIYLYPLLINKQALVMSSCVNGQPVSQISAVLTKSKTADRKYLRKLLAKATVSYSHEYFHENSEKCCTARYGS